MTTDTSIAAAPAPPQLALDTLLQMMSAHVVDADHNALFFNIAQDATSAYSLLFVSRAARQCVLRSLRFPIECTFLVGAGTRVARDALLETIGFVDNGNAHECAFHCTNATAGENISGGTDKDSSCLFVFHARFKKSALWQQHEHRQRLPKCLRNELCAHASTRCVRVHFRSQSAFARAEFARRLALYCDGAGIPLVRHTAVVVRGAHERTLRTCVRSNFNLNLRQRFAWRHVDDGNGATACVFDNEWPAIACLRCMTVYRIRRLLYHTFDGYEDAFARHRLVFWRTTLNVFYVLAPSREAICVALKNVCTRWQFAA